MRIILPAIMITSLQISTPSLTKQVAGLPKRMFVESIMEAPLNILSESQEKRYEYIYKLIKERKFSEARKYFRYGDWPKSKEGNTLILELSKENDTQGVLFLIRVGSEVNDFDSITGKNALHYAVEHNNFKMVEGLVAIDSGIIFREDRLLKTPLVYAIERDNVEMVRIMLERLKADGRNLEEVTLGAMDYPLIHYAVVRGAKKTLKYMIEGAGIDINMLDDWGYAPIHYAIEVENDEIVRLLIKEGCRLDIVAPNGLDPKKKIRKYLETK